MASENITIKFDKGMVPPETVKLFINNIIENACSMSPTYSDKVGLPLEEFSKFYIYGDELKYMDKWQRIITALEDIVIVGLKTRKDFKENKIDKQSYKRVMDHYISKINFLEIYTDKYLLNAKK